MAGRARARMGNVSAGDPGRPFDDCLGPAATLACAAGAISRVRLHFDSDNCTIGAYINHLLEAAAAMFLACGLLLGHASASKRKAWSLVASAMLLIQVVTLVHLPYSLQAGVLERGSLGASCSSVVQAKSCVVFVDACACRRASGRRAFATSSTNTRADSFEDGSFTTTHGRPMWIQFLDFALLTRFGFWTRRRSSTRFASSVCATLAQIRCGDGCAFLRNIVTPEVLEAIRSAISWTSRSGCTMSMCARGANE